MGFLTAFFFPLALQLASQYKCVKVFGGKELAPTAATRGTRSPTPVAKAKSLYMTPYSIPGLSHPVAVVMTGRLGGATFVIALVSLAYSVEPKCS